MLLSLLSLLSILKLLKLLTALLASTPTWLIYIPYCHPKDWFHVQKLPILVTLEFSVIIFDNGALSFLVTSPL
jgi:hypothetical protein